MMYNMYDEDNIDLEEQMYLQDVQDELENEGDDNEIIDDLEDPDYYELTKHFLETELKLKEPDRRTIRILHKKTEKIFEGYVIGQSTTDKNKFVFSVYEIVDKNIVGERKTKIFNFSDIKKR